jgi:hypothetical protein
MSTDRTAFSQRLAKAMQNAGYEPKSAILEREFNLRYWGKSVTLQGVRRWLKGEAIPSGDKLDVIVEWLGVSKHFLLYGEANLIANKGQKLRWDENLTVHDREMIEHLMSLPPDVKKSIGLLLKGISSHLN